MNSQSMYWRRCVLCVAVLGGWAAFVQAQTPEQVADQTLAAARKLHLEKNYPAAVQRFREFLSKFAKHKDADAARFGLVMSLIEGPEKDRNYPELEPLLASLAADAKFPDRHQAAHHLGMVCRTLGMNEAIQIEQRPAEAPQRQKTAQQYFTKARDAFATALALLQPRATAAPASEPLAPEWEAVAKARCDLAEMHYRLGQVKEAQQAVAPFLKDPVLSRSSFRTLACTYYGMAALLAGDVATAQKTLTMVAPYSHPEFGPLARYLLARTHHLSDERPEAIAHYEGAIHDYRKRMSDVGLMLKEPQRFNNDPVIRARLENILRTPPPDYVERASFYLGQLLYEAGKFGEAKARFADFVKMAPQSPMKHEADLRLGMCQVHLKEFADAIKTLQPALDKLPASGDQVLLWIGRAQAEAAPDRVAKFPEYKNAVVAAVATLRQAYDRAIKLGDSPEGQRRRGEIALEIADQLQNIKEFKDAAHSYRGILNEKLLAERAEEVALRLIQASHLAKDWDDTDKHCLAFFQSYPRSTLMPAALFTFAENAYFRASALDKTPASPDSDKALAAAREEAQKRLSLVIGKCPEHPKLACARHALGLIRYGKGEYDAAYKAWSEIPLPDRNGEQAAVNYLMADCILRQTPTAVPDDALAVGKLEEQLKGAIELLDGFVGGNAKDPLAADALLKLGLSQQRRAALFADAKEKQAILQAARATYERMMGTLPQHPLTPQAIFERAKVIIAQGDVGGGMNELRRFTGDPLRQSKIAPIAVIHLATMLRAQNQSAQAAEILQRARDQQETGLAQDPARVSWVALLRLHHGAALRESGKLPEARALFEMVVKQAPKAPVGMEAALRLGQTIKDQGVSRLEEAHKIQRNIRNPQDAANAQNLLNEGYKSIGDAVTFLEKAGDAIKAEPGQAEPGQEGVRARMLYEAAWGARLLSEPELATAKKTVALEQAKKAGPGFEKLPLPDVDPAEVPLLETEKKARGLYRTLIADHGDVPIALDARLELAELLAERKELDPALALLTDLLDKEPPPELTEKARLRIGVIRAAKGDVKGAMPLFEALAANPKSPLYGHAQYQAAEIQLQNGQVADAIKRLVLFRDNGAYHNVPGLTDRALFRLGQAYAMSKGWNESAQAFERVVGFPKSPLADGARYAMGWSLHQNKNYEGAANWYNQLASKGAGELAAKAQYQMGVCRNEQKRWPEAINLLMTIPTVYDYPELSAAALLEASRAYLGANNRDQAVRLLIRVQRDYANTPFAQAAKERLDQIK